MRQLILQYEIKSTESDETLHDDFCSQYAIFCQNGEPISVTMHFESYYVFSN